MVTMCFRPWAAETRKISIAAASILLLGGCANATNAPEASSAVAYVSPLEEFLSAAAGLTPTPEEQLRIAELQSVRISDLIAQCMKEGGFEFYSDVPFGDGAGQIAGEHQVFLDSMSEVESAAWWAAYWGPDIPWDVEIDGSKSWEMRGCQGWAEHEVENEASSSPYSFWAPDEFRPLLDAINQLEQDLMVNPDIVELNSDWAWCMTNAGHPNLDYPGIIRTPENSESEVELADLNCQTETDYVNRLMDIRREVETQFVANHRADLETFRAAAEQRS